jgi:BNR repeat-like domain
MMEQMKRAAILLSLALAPAFAQTFTTGALPNPAGEGSVQPRWSVTPDGGVMLSWIEPSKDDSYSLRYAIYRSNKWSAAQTVASNRHFFRHPAESPEVAELSAGHWMAHWVENPKEDSDAEYVYVSSSTDGVHWTQPAIAHKDRSPVEHGLVSMTADSNGGASLFWLVTPKGEDGPAYLMHTVVDASGREIKEERLDDDVCQCCPTAVVHTSKGLLVVYRNHTPQDIRDIAVLRYENGRWLPSKIVHADNWKIDACPVNAAAVDAKGNRVAISWYTGAGSTPSVKTVFSDDAGATFTKPVTVSTGHAFGYTSVVLDDNGGAIVSWLERGPQNDTRVLVREVTAAGAAGPVLQIAEGGRQAAGYPRVLHSASATFIAWGSDGKLETARLKK